MQGVGTKHDDLARQCRGRFQKTFHITENRLGLINRGGEHETHSLFTGDKPMLLK